MHHSAPNVALSGVMRHQAKCRHEDEVSSRPYMGLILRMASLGHREHCVRRNRAHNGPTTQSLLQGRRAPSLGDPDQSTPRHRLTISIGRSIRLHDGIRSWRILWTFLREIPCSVYRLVTASLGESSGPIALLFFSEEAHPRNASG